MTEEVKVQEAQPAPAQEVPKPEQIFDFDKEAEEQKKKDIETFKNYGLMTEEEVNAKIGEVVATYKKELDTLRAEFAALKEWMYRKKQQGLNSGAIEEKPDTMARWKPAW